MNAAMPKLREAITGYDPKDVFNCDECGLFYRLASERKIALERLAGRKKAKERITFMPCCSKDGTER